MEIRKHVFADSYPLVTGHNHGPGGRVHTADAVRNTNLGIWNLTFPGFAAKLPHSLNEEQYAKRTRVAVR
jgi:hypothetical protein